MLGLSGLKVSGSPGNAGVELAWTVRSRCLSGLASVAGEGIVGGKWRKWSETGESGRGSVGEELHTVYDRCSFGGLRRWHVEPSSARWRWVGVGA